MAFTLLHQSAPWIGFRSQESVVFYSLIGISLILFVIIIWKYRELNQARKIAREYAGQISDALNNMDWIHAMRVTAKYSEQSHLAKILQAGLEERYRLKKRQPSESVIAKHMEQAMERELIVLQNYYRRGLGFVDAIGSTAPFIGALGGSATTFAFGTILAIPTIWFATYFRGKTLVLDGEMKYVASELISYIEKHNTE